MDSNTKKLHVYVRLLNEGTEVYRPVEAQMMDEYHMLLLPEQEYDEDDEEWEFLPGVIVYCEKRILSEGEEVLVAISEEK